MDGQKLKNFTVTLLLFFFYYCSIPTDCTWKASGISAYQSEVILMKSTPGAMRLKSAIGTTTKMYIMDRRAHFHFKHWLSKSCYVGLSWVFEIRCDEIWLRKWWDTITHAFTKGDLLITSYAILYVFDANGTKLLLRNGHYFLKIGHDTGDFKTKT